MFYVPPSHADKRSTCSRKCMGIAKQIREDAGLSRCNVCKQDLPRDRFYVNKGRSNGLCNRCKDCARVGNLQYRQNNREKVRESARTYMRKHRIGQGGFKKEFRGVKNKRAYPQDERCELCGRHKPMKLVYHHWTDLDLSLGMWICRPCHSGVHFLERVGSKKYFSLKERISGEVSPLLVTPTHILFSGHHPSPSPKS